uniref:Uncharacterized protein n=1 Tax=Timema cristinae TaxID=61476 RepID=A0A7R9D768_TIMCR|nr:unnamed protein product [Timema cristinae]
MVGISGYISRLGVLGVVFLNSFTLVIRADAKEGAALTLGLLCLGEVFPHRKEVMQGFLDTSSELLAAGDIHISIMDSALSDNSSSLAQGSIGASSQRSRV